MSSGFLLGSTSEPRPATNSVSGDTHTCVRPISEDKTLAGACFPASLISNRMLLLPYFPTPFLSARTIWGLEKLFFNCQL